MQWTDKPAEPTIMGEVTGRLEDQVEDITEKARGERERWGVGGGRQKEMGKMMLQKCKERLWLQKWWKPCIKLNILRITTAKYYGNIKKYKTSCNNIKSEQKHAEWKNWPSKNRMTMFYRSSTKLFSGLHFSKWLPLTKRWSLFMHWGIKERGQNYSIIAFGLWGRKSSKEISPTEKALKLANKCPSNSWLLSEPSMCWGNPSCFTVLNSQKIDKAESLLRMLLT